MKIKEENKGQKQDCVMQMMNKWLQRGPSSTRAVLIQALDGIEEHTIAARLHEGKDSLLVCKQLAFTSTANVVSMIVHERG